jgi:hypothetical protein
MVIHNFDLVRARFPAETNPPLIIYADAVLSDALSTERLQAVSRGHSQVRQLRRGIQLKQLPPRRPLDIRRQPSREFPAEHPLRLPAPEALDHVACNSNAQRYYRQALLFANVETP